MQRTGGQLAMLVVINGLLLVAGALISDGSFLSVFNLQSMASQVPEIGLLAIGVMLAMCAGNGGIDLSGIALTNLAGVLSAVVVSSFLSANDSGAGLGAELGDELGEVSHGKSREQGAWREALLGWEARPDAVTGDDRVQQTRFFAAGNRDRNARLHRELRGLELGDAVGEIFQHHQGPLVHPCPDIGRTPIGADRFVQDR